LLRVYLRNTIIAGNTDGQITGNSHVSAMIIQSLGHNLATLMLTGTCPRPELPTASYSLPPSRCRDVISEKSAGIRTPGRHTYSP
jgi:hypothetical protein